MGRVGMTWDEQDANDSSGGEPCADATCDKRVPPINAHRAGWRWNPRLNKWLCSAHVREYDRSHPVFWEADYPDHVRLTAAPADPE